MLSFQRRFRLRSTVWTEQRVKVLLEVLGMSFVVVRDDGTHYRCIGVMRAVKYFSYEVHFLQSRSG